MASEEQRSAGAEECRAGARKLQLFPRLLGLESCNMEPVL